MEVTEVMPCLRITQEKGLVGCEMYVDVGDKINIVDYDGKETNGTLMSFEVFEDSVLLKIIDSADNIHIIDDIDICRVK